jgi:hypothetical protein
VASEVETASVLEYLNAENPHGREALKRLAEIT